MLFKNQVPSALNSNRMALKLAALLLSSLIMLPAVGALLSRTAAATDLESLQNSAGSDGQFVRIGLNKSIVIRLPAEAHDVIVGNPEIVDAVVRSKNTAYLFARGIGQTNIFFFDKAGQQILNLDLEVAVDAMALQKLIQRSIPGTRITVEWADKNVVLTGTANAADAKLAIDIAQNFANISKTQMPSLGIVNAIRIAGEDQVMLKVRVVEIQRDVIKQFGVNLQALLSVGKFAFNLASIGPLAGATGAKAVYTDGANSLTAVIRALEGEGLLKTLAEPNLTAISGQEAKFHAGGEVPIPTCTNDSGVRTCEITYKEFGVSLNFTPLVLSEGRINLKIKSDVSEIGPQIDGNTSFISRSTETVIELPSGGSMMMAGLIKDTTRQNIDATPGLKKLPVLGSLFRSRDYEQNQTELVVIVTPYLVGAVAEKQLATPDNRFNNPSDSQTILLGRLNKVYGTVGESPDGVYHGNVGFIVE